MTKQEAASLGGKATVKRHGPDYMRELGRKGGLLGGRPRVLTLAEIKKKGCER